MPPTAQRKRRSEARAGQPGFADEPAEFVHDEIMRGVAAKRVKDLVNRGILEAKQVFRVIPERTFNRRVANREALKPQEADAIGRLLRLNREAVRLFGDAEFAKKWLSLPNPALGYRVPNDLAETDAGAREVETILLRIAHGVYS
jgi:putative toxin-antitoxin system antitoxin component (TIGR02293 family)